MTTTLHYTCGHAHESPLGSEKDGVFYAGGHLDEDHACPACMREHYSTRPIFGVTPYPISDAEMNRRRWDALGRDEQG